MTTTETAPPAIDVRSLRACYGKTRVLDRIDLRVEQNSVTCILGANGAGKTTLMRAIEGSVRVTSGTVSLLGTDVTRVKQHRRGRLGVTSIPEGRGIFRTLTVAENLRLSVPPWEGKRTIDPALETFPALAGRLSARAGQLSGGQQQMLAVARAFLASPKVVLIDEVSMGLAPNVIDELFDALLRLRSTGAALVIVEQFVQRALAIADNVLVLTHGAVSFAGPADQVDAESLLQSYLGSAPTNL
jgi:branched-chain amino acid transport system ATP-binding protein